MGSQSEWRIDLGEGGLETLALLLSEGKSATCVGCFVCKHCWLFPLALDETSGYCLLVSGAVNPVC